MRIEEDLFHVGVDRYRNIIQNIVYNTESVECYMHQESHMVLTPIKFYYHLN